MSFTFKQFHIDDHLCAMKVGTDSILLGCVAQVEQAHRVLDIGSGCGLLSLMVAQRLQTDGQITAIELDHNAVEQARENISHSPWPNKITVVHCDINLYQSEQPFDLVISNPPYFVNSLLAPADIRCVATTMARHTQALTQAQLLACVTNLLSEEGTFWLILPVKEAQWLIEQSERFGLWLQQLYRIASVEGRAPHRYIMAWVKYPVGSTQQQDIAVYQQNNQYSNQFIALTRNFYLNRV